MVKPYLSRLRPAESGRLHPRLRSRFEPAPRLPIDGLAIGQGLPPAWDPPAADVETELDREAPYPHRAGPAVTRAALGEQGLPPARAAAPEPAARDTERPPGRAAGPAGPPPPGPPATATTSETELDRNPPYPRPAGPAVTPAPVGEQGLPPARAAAPEPAARDTERPPGRAAGPAGPPPSPPASTATTSEIVLDRDAPYPHRAGPAVTRAALGEQGLPPARAAAPEPAARDTERPPGRAARPAGPPPPSPPATAIDFDWDAPDPRLAGPAQSAGGEHARAPSSSAQRPASSSTAQRPAPSSAAQRPAPWPRYAPPEQAPGLGDRVGRGQGAEPMSPEPVPSERPPPAPHRRLDRASHPADAPADRVWAMARWLRGMGAGTATNPSSGPGSAAMDPEVTVTIGRIEVKAPTANPAPARPQPSRPQRRVPSLGDYLESRTRARGRRG